jgi:hypothetical protein
MDKGFLEAVTKTLREFAQAKFSSQVLELNGPVQEGLSYRWRLMSTRYREVTVLLVTKKPVFGKPSAARFEVYGFEGTKDLEPEVEALQSFLSHAELTPHPLSSSNTSTGRRRPLFATVMTPSTTRHRASKRRSTCRPGFWTAS